MQKKDYLWELDGVPFTILAAIVLLAAYIPMLLRSFWVDETMTLWMAHGSVADAIQRTFQVPGQSLLFSAISSFFVRQGPVAHEFLLRIPALAGGFLLCWLLYRFAEDSIGSGAGKIAVILGCLNPTTINLASQARPYSLAMAATTGSAWALFRWVRDGERKWLVCWVFTTALVIHLQYFFVVALLAQLAYVIVVRKGVAGVLIGSAVVFLTCLPLLPQVRLLLQKSGTLPFMTSPPGFSDLLFGTVPVGLIAGLIGVGVAALRAFSGLRFSSGREWVVMMMVWWLAGPLLLFELARHTTMNVYVPRYFSYSVPALSMLLTAAGFGLFGARKGAVWALLGGLLATVLGFSVGPGAEELRPFMALVEKEGASAPLIFSSELSESNFKNWRAGNISESYLYTPFFAYPIRNRLIALPRLVDRNSAEYLHEITAKDLATLPKLLLVTRNPNWLRVVTEELTAFGFVRTVQEPNTFYVATFRKPLALEAGGGHSK